MLARMGVSLQGLGVSEMLGHRKRGAHALPRIAPLLRKGRLEATKPK